MPPNDTPPPTSFLRGGYFGFGSCPPRKESLPPSHLVLCFEVSTREARHAHVLCL